jgi:arginine decarboxylase
MRPQKPGMKWAILGNRIPRTYCCTAGFGQSDEGSGLNPYETESYDAALMAAKLENFNILTYSSVLPPEAVEVPLDTVVQRFHHGAVSETIMAVVSATKGKIIVAAVGRIQVYDQHGTALGGFAAEFTDIYNAGTTAEAEAQARQAIAQSLHDEYERRYKGRGYRYEHHPLTLASGVIEQAYGTALAALVWVDYLCPVLGEIESTLENQ